MMRLNMLVEGVSEERFANELLIRHLAEHGVYACAQMVQTGRKSDRMYKGGLRSYARFRSHLKRWLKQDQNSDVRFTSMIDLYALPADFPGYQDAKAHANPHRKVATLECALADDIADRRFVSYIQLHEFEALLLSKPGEFMSVFWGQPPAVRSLGELVSKYDSPEEIDDGQQTAPSKRIAALFPDYPGQKTLASLVIAQAIGLQAMADRCPHFRAWLSRLESLGADAPAPEGHT